MAPEVVIVLYALASALEIYLFLMQRACLEISRAGQIDPKAGRHMLPQWYVLVWPNKLLRWILLFFIWEAHGWFALISAWAIVALATTFMPVPFRHFLPIFQRKVSRNYADIASGVAAPSVAQINLSLTSALSSVQEVLELNEKG